MVTEKLVKAEEVAYRVGINHKTLQNWYQFKRTYPEHPLSKLIPDVIQDGPRHTRYWRESDIDTLLEFKTMLPRGRTGLMGAVTQKYNKK